MGVARAYTGVADTRCRSIYQLRRARRNLHFDPPKHGDGRPTGELIDPLYDSLLTPAADAVDVTTYGASCGLQIAGRHPVVLEYYGRHCVNQGRGWLSTVPFVLFNVARTALYRLLSPVIGFI